MEYFDTETESFEIAPWLNMARSGHSSCMLGNTIYTFCGENEGGFLSSLERQKVRQPEQRNGALSFPGCISGSEGSWELIEISGQIIPRKNALVAPLNGNKIAILGG